jgi:hypothetical protein
MGRTCSSSVEPATCRGSPGSTAFPSGALAYSLSIVASGSASVGVTCSAPVSVRLRLVRVMVVVIVEVTSDICGGRQPELAHTLTGKPGKALGAALRAKQAWEVAYRLRTDAVGEALPTTGRISPMQQWMVGSRW